MPRRYAITLGSNLERDLTNMARKLQITKSEVMRRALMLFKHAVYARSVKLQAYDDSWQTVLVK